MAWPTTTTDPLAVVPFARRNVHRLRLFAPTLDQPPDHNYEEDEEWMPREPHEGEQANVVSSLCTDGFHRPCLDIDVPVEVVPSSTPGHVHLYFPSLAMPWATYEALLRALADAGIVEHGWVSASQAREQTCLRLPGQRRLQPRAVEASSDDPW